jgi:FAD/FMN-containing dehydrogenase
MHPHAGGVLEVTPDNDPELFRLARVGLGCLGVVTELTLKVLPLRHRVIASLCV